MDGTTGDSSLVVSCEAASLVEVCFEGGVFWCESSLFGMLSGDCIGDCFSTTSQLSVSGVEEASVFVETAASGEAELDSCSATATAGSPGALRLTVMVLIDETKQQKNFWIRFLCEHRIVRIRDGER